MNGIVIRPEGPSDRAAIEDVLIATFRDTDDVGTVNALRRTGELTLGLVAEVEGAVAGYLACVAVPVEPDPGYPLWALAALPFRPDGRRWGIVSAVVQDALARARAAGVGFVALLGDPSFYASFGFRAELTRGLRAPWSGHFYLGLALAEVPPPVGVARYPRAFLG